MTCLEQSFEKSRKITVSAAVSVELTMIPQILSCKPTGFVGHLARARVWGRPQSRGEQRAGLRKHLCC